VIRRYSTFDEGHELRERRGLLRAPGALGAVEIVVAADLGVHVVPNVWMHHPIG
jgi:hypothetical protein